MKKFLSCLGFLAVAFGIFSAVKAEGPDDEVTRTFDIAVVGNCSGKDNLICFCATGDSEFDGFIPATIATPYECLELPEINVKLHIWDVPVQERFCSIARSYMNGSQAVIVACDIDENGNWLEVDDWMNFLKNSWGGFGELPTIVIGNSDSKQDEKSRKVIKGECLN